jgi:hypothetical protein
MAKQSQDLFFFGGLNTDDEDRLIPDGDYRSANHARGGNAGDSNDGAITSMAGNLLYDNPSLAAGVNTVVGSCPWVEGDSIIYFVHNDELNHSIWQYSISTQGFTLILQDGILNFKVSSKVYDAKVTNNILYWTDGYFNSYLVDAEGYWDFNPPRMINIASAIAGYPSIDEQVLDVIKYPPPYAAETIGYDTDPNIFSNKLYGQLYQFATQWVYENDEESVWSPISELPVPVRQEFISGRNYLDSLEENIITLEVPTGSFMVKKLRVAVRSGNIGQFGIFTELDKSLEGIADDTTHEVVFNGLNALIPITLAEGLRNYDRVPQVANWMELLPTKQLCYGQFVEGYDPIEINLDGARVLHEIRGTTIKKSTIEYAVVFVPASTTSLFLVGFDSAVIYPFQPNDVLSFNLTHDVTINNGSLFAFNFTVTEEILQATIGLSVLDAQINLTLAICTELSSYLTPLGYTCTIVLGPTYYRLQTDPPLGTQDITTISALPLTDPKKSLKKGATHEFGIQYYDRGMRSGGVLTSDTATIYVPYPSQDGSEIALKFADTHSPYWVSPRMYVKHEPPSWARYYQILARKTTEVLNFQYRTVTLLELDVQNPQLWKLSLDNYYESAFQANVNHTPQKGDIVRFVNTSVDGIDTLPAYVNNYIEVEVQSYDAAGGQDGAEAIWVTQFEYGMIGNYQAFLIEIYTPRKDAINEPWFEIGMIKNILNPYTANRYHEGDLYLEKNVISSPAPGGFDFVVGGDLSVLTDSGSNYTITFTPAVGLSFIVQVSFVAYDPIADESTITVFDPSPGLTYLVYTFNTNQTEDTPATLELDFGDVYVRPRISNKLPDNFWLWRYYVEDPSVSDYYISNWSDYGRVGIQDTKFRRRELVSLIHGGAYIDNSNNNNICSFDFNLLNKQDMSEEFGQIYRIIINGYTLKVIQARKETSVYIQRTMAVGGDGGQNVSYTDRTFGGVNPYDSLYGTVHPGSVRVVDGQLFYYDYNSGMFVMSINNGQQDISGEKFKFNKYTTNLTNFIGTFGGPTAWSSVSAVDEFNAEYKFWISDGETSFGAAFNYGEGRWKSFLQYRPDWAENLGAYSVEFTSDADMYVCNEGPQCNFFGVQYPFDFEFMFNHSPLLVKRPLAMGLRANAVPTVYVNVPTGLNYSAMATTIDSTLFENYENGVWAEYQRDELDENVDIPYLATVDLARLNGKEMRGYVAAHTVSYDSPADKVVVISARVNYVPSEATE